MALVSKRLTYEFGDRFDAAARSLVAAEEVASLREARIQDFVPILAFRRARARLRDLMRQRQLDRVASP